MGQDSGENAVKNTKLGLFPLATLSPAEFPDAFDKFVSFATALADRLDAERAGMSVTPDGGPPADGESPAFDPGLISV